MAAGGDAAGKSAQEQGPGLVDSRKNGGPSKQEERGQEA